MTFNKFFAISNIIVGLFLAIFGFLFPEKGLLYLLLVISLWVFYVLFNSKVLEGRRKKENQVFYYFFSVSMVTLGMIIGALIEWLIRR